MKNDLPLLQSTTLFSGLSAEELQALLTRLGAVERSFGRGEVLVLAGAPSRRVGVVLSGELEAYRPGPEGARVPITRVEPGGVFGDVLGGSSLASPVTVLAATACEVLLVPYEQLLLSDGSPAHQRVLQNLVRTISDKYFLLSRRVDLLVLKSLRAKVCAYLLNESERAGSLTFSIPFSRVQLADYLNCDRSALSRELSLMQKDGLLDTFIDWAYRHCVEHIGYRTKKGNITCSDCGHEWHSDTTSTVPSAGMRKVLSWLPYSSALRAMRPTLGTEPMVAGSSAPWARQSSMTAW